MTPLAALRRGLEILDPTMRANGFAFSQEVSGRGSGGNYARGSYIKGDRRLELHYRFSLRLVTYHIGGDALRHEVCVRFWEPTNGAGIRGFRTTRWLRFKIFDLILRLTPETSFAAQEIYFGGACGMPAPRGS
jgi:hypothetical protein